jgi:hypothetical protein
MLRFHAFIRAFGLPSLHWFINSRHCARNPQPRTFNCRATNRRSQAPKTTHPTRQVEYFDNNLFKYLGHVAQGIRPWSYNTQAVSNIANAFAKADIRDEELFEFLAEVTLNLKDPHFTAQGVSNLLNAFGKLDIRHPQVRLWGLGFRV